MACIQETTQILQQDAYRGGRCKHLKTGTSFEAGGNVNVVPSDSDPLAVVDEQLRVKGVQGLRVVDCSIMPQIISGNTNAAAIMIAEKAADMIKSDQS